MAADSEEKAERRSWASFLTGTWRLTHVPGDHMSILRDPYALKTSQLIWEQLEPAQRREPATTQRRERSRPGCSGAARPGRTSSEIRTVQR